MKKDFITGVIVGGLLFGAAAALASQYTATPNVFPIQLNGQNVGMSGYNIEGYTYFKLRDIADAVGGFTVDFNNNTIRLAKDGYVYPSSGNKYNEQGYINTSGRTISEVADSVGMSLEEFLSAFGLPADMPGDTEETAAYYTMPVRKIAEQYGTDFETLKSELGFADSVTPDTKWGDAEATVRVGTYVGEENLDNFKNHYGLGDEVTADTLWGEIRNIVDQKNKEENMANGE